MSNDELVMESSGKPSLAQAMDHALKRALCAPTLPGDFHARLDAAINRSSTITPAAQRASLEQEYQAQLLEIRQGYLHLRLRTLGTLIGSAFASGVAVTLAMPWLHSKFGDDALFAAPLAGLVFVLVVGLRTWSLRLGMPRLFL